MKIFFHQIFQAVNVRIIMQFFFILLGHFTYAQTSSPMPCGTPDLTDYIGDTDDLPRIHMRSGQVKYYPLQIHSVGRSDGEGHLSALEMRRALCVLNEDFAEYGIQFFMKDPVRMIHNDDYYEHDQNDGHRLMRNHNVKNAFNVYVVEYAYGTCGYFSPANQGVVVAKNCFKGGTHTLTHEMGHFFGLPHTFNGWENRKYDRDNVPRYLSIRGRDTLFVERVDGKHCDKAGDFFCDTPPDYINYRWSCDREGNSLETFVDPEGVEFKLDGTNFMSYSSDNCQRRFTPEQEIRMHEILEDRYKNLEYKFIPPAPVSGEEISMIEPRNADDIDITNTRLIWGEIPDATQYIVQISRFTGILFDRDPSLVTFHTDDPELVVPEDVLDVDRDFYWRVYPVNEFTFCPQASEIRSFTPRAATHTHQLPDGEEIKIFPNMISAGQGTIQVQYDFAQARDVTIRLYDLQGRLLRQADERVVGEMITPFDAGRQSAGMYLLRITDGQFAITQKIIVQ